MKTSEAGDQSLVENFLKEFVGKLVSLYGRDIDFVLLFGSAARGEWKLGVSDVDLIIQAKDKEKIEEIYQFAQEIFWQLDEKHQTGFKEVCSISEKDAVDKALKAVKLYVPFIIFGPGDIDWKKAQIKKPELLLGVKLLAPQATLFSKMKNEGKILYGRDIRKEIILTISFWEKWKALLIPFYLSFFSIIISAIYPRKALKIAFKAVLYCVESVLFFLDLPLGPKTKTSIAKLERELRRQVTKKYHLLNFLEINILLNFDWRKLIGLDLTQQSLRLKYDWENASKEFNLFKTIKFSWQSFFFVNRMNWYAIWQVKKDKILLKIIFISVILTLITIIYFIFRFLI